MKKTYQKPTAEKRGVVQSITAQDDTRIIVPKLTVSMIPVSEDYISLYST